MIATMMPSQSKALNRVAFISAARVSAVVVSPILFGGGQVFDISIVPGDLSLFIWGQSPSQNEITV